jgi:hypothetical protein
MSAMDPYSRAQIALSELKSCIRQLLLEAGDGGLSNAEIGRRLGIYMGMIDKDKPTHEGQIPRILLGMMKVEGSVYQPDGSKKWVLRAG